MAKQIVFSSNREIQGDLTGCFLLAMPTLGVEADEETPFAGTLIYICEHTKEGALGIVINRLTDLTVVQLFEGAGVPVNKLSLDSRWQGMPVHWGGPVRNDRGFILHRPLGEWQSTLTVRGELGMTTSRDLLEAMASGEGPEEALVSLGYAGWSEGQLEQELAQNAWLVIPCEDAEKLLFRCDPMQRIQEAMKQIGVDWLHFSGNAGHA
ncbi:MAG: YqgE/AlgH family protein [Burkholderiales bacterium]|nr:YqgE/AlgH family protein [Burkholderiales bacterium]